MLQVLWEYNWYKTQIKVLSALGKNERAIKTMPNKRQFNPYSLTREVNMSLLSTPHYMSQNKFLKYVLVLYWYFFVRFLTKRPPIIFQHHDASKVVYEIFSSLMLSLLFFAWIF